MSEMSCAHASIYLYAYVCIHIYIYIYTHTYMYIYTHTHNVCIYIYIYREREMYYGTVCGSYNQSRDICNVRCCVVIVLSVACVCYMEEPIWRILYGGSYIQSLIRRVQYGGSYVQNLIWVSIECFCVNGI